MNAWSFSRPLPVGSQLGTLRRRIVRQSRMGHNHLLKQSQGMAMSGSANVLSLAWSAMPAGQAQGKRKTRRLRRTISTFGFFLFLPSITPAPPWSIKGRAGHPTMGTDQFHAKHTAKQQPSSWHPFDPFIRDLGPVPLSTVCTPYYEPFLVLIT